MSSVKSGEREKLVQRFIKKTKVSANECWEWQASLTNTGYGQFRFGSRMVGAHRFSYFVLKQGKSQVPVGQDTKVETISHLCHNRMCVNPEHLVQEPLSRNYQRTSSLKTHCPQGHQYSSDNLMEYGLANGQRVCHKCNFDRNRKLSSLLDEAAKALSISKADYVKKYGRSATVAKLFGGGNN